MLSFTPYIREYTQLNPKEQRQLFYKRQYKQDYPNWDDSMVLLKNLVAERLPAQAAVLDLGCGHGNFVIDELREIFGTRIGFDVDAASTTKNTSVERVVIGDGKNLPFPDQAFDLVLSLWTMEHVPDPLTLFAEAARILKPGGYFAFVTPNRSSLLIFIRRLLSKRTADHLLDYFYGRKDDDVFDVYYRANTIKDIGTFAGNAGFEVEILRENADPSYTAFGRFTYALSAWFSRRTCSLSKPHLMAVLKKQS